MPKILKLTCMACNLGGDKYGYYANKPDYIGHCQHNMHYCFNGIFGKTFNFC